MEFSNALNICATGYSCGHYTVVLPENLQERYGNTLLKFFQDTLARKIGEDVNLTCITDLGGSKTFVQMRQVNVPQHRLDQELITSPQAASSVDCASPGDAVVAGQAKVPRPMNCFIYFRNAMAPQLLKEDPTLGVKHLSKRVSVIWKTFSAEQKEYWKLQAAAGTALHKRLNPDYKYQPRKSSQIKKRQSRKAKQASAAATVTAATAPAAAEAFRFAPVSEMMVATNNTEVTAAGQANVNNSFASDVAQAIDPTAFFGLQEQHLAHHLQLHETESLRYDRLHAEFDSAIGMNMTFEQFGEEAFAFRAGANGDATLPSIYSDGY
ncbi:hypothetical protein CC86DRAFT_398251 [Ophiobolus disseminans]|uniref:HMG box domain-containing protein n=1 Tax=Ophiobolus disseminans TaxID=1469910 RepID=A0A6A6ZFW5_9PLEO|nr:hypothetical protein CC86DRAFT_398251 [Ophiobolus disseminans]